MVEISVAIFPFPKQGSCGFQVCSVRVQVIYIDTSALKLLYVPMLFKNIQKAWHFPSLQCLNPIPMIVFPFLSCSVTQVLM